MIINYNLNDRFVEVLCRPPFQNEQRQNQHPIPPRKSQDGRMLFKMAEPWLHTRSDRQPHRRYSGVSGINRLAAPALHSEQAADFIRNSEHQ